MMAPSLEIYGYEGEGYAPLLTSKDWQVALLNWEPLFDRANLIEIERHNASDEIFVLLRGKAVLFTRAEGGALHAQEMEFGKFYNVPRGVWHNLVATHEVKFLIVEDRDTHLHDTEVRSIEAAELEALDAQLPEWAKPKSELD